MNAAIWDPQKAMPDNREFEVYHVVDTNWNAFVFHAHVYYEFYFFLRGDIHFAIEDELYEVNKYDMFIFPQGLMHKNFPNNLNSVYERAYFYVSRNCLRNMSTEDCDLLSTVDRLVEQKRFKVNLGQKTFLDFLNQMDQIISHADDAHPVQRLINRCRMNMLLASCCDRLSTQASDDSRSNTALPGQVIHYINEHLTESISLDLLAERFFVSKYYLLHEFKDFTNTSVYQYILTKRIVYSQMLLQQGFSSQETGIKCGFCDYAGFYRAFKRKVGMSPQQYVNLIRGESAVSAAELPISGEA